MTDSSFTSRASCITPIAPEKSLVTSVHKSLFKWAKKICHDLHLPHVIVNEGEHLLFTYFGYISFLSFSGWTIKLYQTSYTDQYSRLEKFAVAIRTLKFVTVTCVKLWKQLTFLLFLIILEITLLRFPKPPAFPGNNNYKRFSLHRRRNEQFKKYM